MKEYRPTFIAAIAIGLLAGTSIGVAAQDLDSMETAAGGWMASQTRLRLPRIAAQRPGHLSALGCGARYLESAIAVEGGGRR